MMYFDLEWFHANLIMYSLLNFVIWIPPDLCPLIISRLLLKDKTTTRTGYYITIHECYYLE